MRHLLLPLLVGLAGCGLFESSQDRHAAADGGADLSPASTAPKGPIPGSPRDPGEFVRPHRNCECVEKMGACKCRHCEAESGAKCYCDEGEPKCLCGIDMAGCRCSHCVGREGGSTCPCDHSKTRAALKEGSDAQAK
jgi:hypothetical protein